MRWIAACYRVAISCQKQSNLARYANDQLLNKYTCGHAETLSRSAKHARVQVDVKLEDLGVPKHIRQILLTTKL